MSVSSQLAEPQLNATPLIDVLLVLLVMLIFTLPVATHAVKLNLPQPRAGTPPPEARLDIVAEGDIYWNGERLDRSQLSRRLVALAGDADAPLLRVSAEKRAPYEVVAQVLAAAQRSRVTRMTLTPVPD